MQKIPHQLTENVKLLHKVALIHQNKILLLQRSAQSQSRPEKWDLAGGNSEWPEIKRQGHGVHQNDVAREVVEETGIVIPKTSFDFSALTYFDTYFDAQKQIVTIICGWKYQLPQTFNPENITISEEHSQMQWVEKGQLDQIDFGGIKGEFVKQICLAAF
jgi:8-oxo-dGTP pyrophosphatase MutT (NUDIX family)